MLSKRYSYDKKPLLILDDLQLKNKKIVEDKINSKEYSFEKVKCAVCNGEEFELLAEKDRYGFYVSTVICKKCGLLQTNPRMTQDSYNKFYDAEYRKLYVGQNKPLPIYFNDRKVLGNKIYNFVAKALKKPITDKFIVEIGAGAGGILQAFKEKNNAVLGLDLGSQYIKFGKDNGLDLRVGTTKELSNIKKKPDVVIYSHVLEHILNPVEELKALRKYLKPTSLVVIIVPGVKNLLNSYSQDFLRYLQNAHVYHFSLTSLKNIANKAGYMISYGDERVYAILEPGKINENYDNDYNEAMHFLRKLEKIRSNPFNYYKWRDGFLNFISMFLTATKTKKLFKRLQNKLKR